MPPRAAAVQRGCAFDEQRLVQLRAELLVELHRLRTELLRWMFALWVTTLLGMAGLLIALRVR